MQEQHQDQFWVRFKDVYAASLFERHTGGAPILSQHNYCVVGAVRSKSNRQSVDITITNGGGSVNIDVIRKYAELFQGFDDIGTIN
jgi:hypothetical protein